jgi:hypothetical protein
MIRFSGLAVAIVVLGGAVGSAQAPAPAAAPAGGQRGGQPAMTNLQIIPKDMPREQVIATMQRFTQALGVQCNYCHVQEGRGGRNDFASDEKQPKKTAREMMKMTADLTSRLPGIVGKPANETTRVGCATCHRGVPVPKLIGDIVTETAATGGASAALAKFKELREKYYGGQSYDFSEGSLIVIAQSVNAANKADDALAYLNANLEYYPKSARTYATIGQIKNAKGDKAGAMAALEKAVELDPNNAQAKAQLENLKK